MNKLVNIVVCSLLAFMQCQSASTTAMRSALRLGQLRQQPSVHRAFLSSPTHSKLFSTSSRMFSDASQPVTALGVRAYAQETGGEQKGPSWWQRVSPASRRHLALAGAAGVTGLGIKSLYDAPEESTVGQAKAQTTETARQAIERIQSAKQHAVEQARQAGTYIADSVQGAREGLYGRIQKTKGALGRGLRQASEYLLAQEIKAEQEAKAEAIRVQQEADEQVRIQQAQATAYREELRKKYIGHTTKPKKYIASLTAQQLAQSFNHLPKTEHESRAHALVELLAALSPDERDDLIQNHNLMDKLVVLAAYGQKARKAIVDLLLTPELVQEGIGDPASERLFDALLVKGPEGVEYADRIASYLPISDILEGKQINRSIQKFVQDGASTVEEYSYASLTPWKRWQYGTKRFDNSAAEGKLLRRLVRKSPAAAESIARMLMAMVQQGKWRQVPYTVIDFLAETHTAQVAPILAQLTYHDVQNIAQQDPHIEPKNVDALWDALQNYSKKHSRYPEIRSYSSYGQDDYGENEFEPF